MKKLHYISVILPLKLAWEPSYAIPDGTDPEEVKVGDRVKVSFANREYSGVVSAVGITPDTTPEKIKPILSFERELERIYPKEIELWRAVADYYLCSIGEVYKAAYPYGKISLEEARAAAKSKVRIRREKLLESIRRKLATLETRLSRKEEQHSKARKESTKEGYAKEIDTIRSEIERVRESLEEVSHMNMAESSSVPFGQRPQVSLTEAQETAFRGIKKGFDEDKPVLLHGITGSGKTEIYIKLATEALDSGKNVLYLVPEIALSRQLEDRLYAYFGERMLIFHSGESAASKRNVAETIRSSTDGYIVLGTRSSLFLPHHDLGLIIVDEEHDNSYKQDSPAPRYNGRDTALMLKQIHGCDIILGSATPSLEEMYNCRAGKHVLIELKQRFHGSEDSKIEIIDTKAERRKNGMVGNFSRKLIAHMNETLKNRGQIIILRSRRSWAPVMQCESCGEIVRCPHCNVSMSSHKNGLMVCHYCGHSEPYKGRCSKCNGSLMSLGAGTQKIEDEAKALFPDACIARLDSDTAQSRQYEKGIIRDFGNGKIDILIGTQIVTKGFDFGRLSLVAVIAADSLLGMQDFRADEKALQLMEQFRGRCGRREDRGLFVIQTSQPEHPVYQSIRNNEASDFNTALLMERKDFRFPPFTRIIEITVRDMFEDRADRMAGKLGEHLHKAISPAGTSLLSDPVTGPYVPVIDKIADKYIRTIRISLKKDRKLSKEKQKIMTTIYDFEKSQKYDGHITVNVDPS